ncbi:PepSY domain-containing protein [Streptomyces sp. NBC_00879]|nr:PepSY domain-containing protein [Streptomyces sp. NBC_00879]
MRARRPRIDVNPGRVLMPCGDARNTAASFGISKIRPADSRLVAVTSVPRRSPYLLAKLSKLGVQGHMGALFGIVNQIVLAVIALSLTAVTIWGYRMWWLRHPPREDRRAQFGKAPARGAWRQLPLPVLILGIPAVAALGWALPVLGVTLLGFLVLDVAVGLVRRVRTA